MIKLNSLSKTSIPRKKRLGQGHGSGKGKTGGRGTKGQGARGKIPVALKEMGISFIKRLPLYKGKYRNKPIPHKPLAVNLKYLNLLPKNAIVDVEMLIKHNIIDKSLSRLCGVKILGEGEIKVPLTVKLPCSKGAVTKIEKAGGKIEK